MNLRNATLTGTVPNDSPYRIIVRTTYVQGEKYPQGPDQEAILEPGGVMPYVLWESGTLEFFRAPEGIPEGPASELFIVDRDYGLPWTAFTPPGFSKPLSIRKRGWREQVTHVERWGETKLKVTREKDGWRIPDPSQAYKNRYGAWITGSSDYQIFTIRVEGLDDLVSD